MSTQPRTPLTSEEYLEIERKAAYKSEFCQDEMFAMARASREHNLPVASVVRELGQQIRRPLPVCFGS